jgi:vacuolar-type H+-ATPase subunit I/STV1
VDPVIEIVASLVVVWQLRGSTNANRQRTALRIMAIAFGALALYLGVQVAATLARGSHAGHLTAGIVWLALTVCAMLALAAAKRDTGRRLANPVLATEAHMTLIDAAVAAAVLTGVALNAVVGWWWLILRRPRSSSSTPPAKRATRGRSPADPRLVSTATTVTPPWRSVTRAAGGDQTACATWGPAGGT